MTGSAWILLVALLPAHGVEHSVEKSKCIKIHVEYDDGSPMEFADVEAYAPGKTDEPYMVLQTDEKGNVCFLPSDVKAGEWTFRIDDGLGHGAVVRVNVESTGAVKTSTTVGCPQSIRILAGVGVIWGLAGLFFYLAARRRLKPVRD